MSPKVLIVEDDAGLREALVDTLSLSDYSVVEADCAEQALLLLKKQTVDLVLTDVQMGTVSGLALLRSIKSQWPTLPVVLMTAFGNIHDAVEAMKEGACDYLAKPFSPKNLLTVITRYLTTAENSKSSMALAGSGSALSNSTPIFGDPVSEQLLAMARQVAQSDATVMILGPSGSGKEVIARYIHQQSSRADKPFVAINCAAIPENMLEATLFGYEKGAFTGALSATPGKFEQAQQGTLLLDEITEMDLALQSKLLRVLQEREVERLGGRKTIKLDVRILATSNRDLSEAVNQGMFREDLYYRLNVFPIQWLALSQRGGDILPLAEHLIAKHWQHHPLNGQQQLPCLTVGAKNKLLGYPWPGNVRELENIIQRALILLLPVPGMPTITEIDIQHILLPQPIQTMAMAHPQPQAQAIGGQPIIVQAQAQSVAEDNHTASNDHLNSELLQQEQRIILDTLHACSGSRKAVAEQLGISPRTLRYKLAKMREQGISIPA